MVKLSDLQVAALLEEIGCAMRVGTPVLDSMRRLHTRRLGRVGRAAGRIAEGLERGESVSGAVAVIDTPVRRSAAAAIKVCEQNADPGLIERLVIQLRQRSDFARDLRLSWFYPWLLMAVGYAVAVLVMAPLIRHFSGRELRWAPWVVGLASWLETNWWWPPMLFIAFFILVLIALGSRERFPRRVRFGLFCSALADQFEHDVPEAVAIRAAAEFCGDSELVSIDQPSLQSPAVARIVAPSDQFLGEQTGLDRKQSLIAQLRYLASVHLERARQQSYIWSRLVPRTAMVIFGGGLILSYAWWVIVPVYLQVAQW